MAFKRSRKVKKRQKALQRRHQQQPTSTRHPVTQIPPEHADQFAMTTTGEIMQPIRLHYEVLDGEQLRATFSTLRGLDYDAPRKRWVWLYMEEARGLSFKDKRAADSTVLGEFVFKDPDEVVLNLRSFERATKALGFFDQHIPRTVARVTAVTVSNRVISLQDASSLTSLDHYFDRAEVVIHDAESMVQRLQDIASSTADTQERIALAGKYREEKAKTPLPPMERVAQNYYEDGIHSVEALLAPRKVIAMQHWQGNTSYTYHDFVLEMCQHGRRGVLSRCILTGYRILGFREAGAEGVWVRETRASLETMRGMLWIRHLPPNFAH